MVPALEIPPMSKPGASGVAKACGKLCASRAHRGGVERDRLAQ